MEYAMHAREIRAVIDEIDKLEGNERTEALMNLVRNVVAHVNIENHSKTNWLAYELFSEVIDEESISNIFDE